jgi:hypothetical protein
MVQFTVEMSKVFKRWQRRIGQVSAEISRPIEPIVPKYNMSMYCRRNNDQAQKNLVALVEPTLQEWRRRCNEEMT